MRIAIAGRKGLGGVHMRGIDVAAVVGWEFHDLGDLPSGHFDTLILIKYHLGHAQRLRTACDRLIFDPLDCWESDSPKSEAGEFWQRLHRELQFDDVLATSPACAETIAACLPECSVHRLPHHADPRIAPDWCDPTGPVVYSGGKQYLDRYHADIERACRRLKRPLICNFGKRPVDTLKGAALHLHPRFPHTDSPLNRLCKPQVKLANAAAAGCPILATPHPSFTSLEVGGCLIDRHDHWERLLVQALESPPPQRQPTLAEHAARLKEIVGC